jgi:cytochrome c5
VILAVAGAPARAQQPPPEGEGRDIVAVACTQCHAPSAYTQLREGSQAWRFRVYDMILRGAQIEPADIDKVVSYLMTSFGPGVPFPTQPPIAVTLPDGPGKELVEGGCAICHDLDRVVATTRPARQWDAMVKQMVFLGAPLSADQAKTVTAYLSTRFGRPGQETAAK